ncbi:ketopantoate reductase family protein [Chloroflexota bacterium]
MRIIIYGAGGIGCVVGGNMARTGNEVVLIGRPGQVKAINEHGLRLVTPAGTDILRIPAITEPGQIDYKADDVVFLCVKGQNTEEAIRDLKAVTEDIPVFCFQNGVRNEHTVAQYFPRVYGVMLFFPTLYLTDGEVFAQNEPPGWFIIGQYPKGTDELLEAVATKLRTAGFLVKTVPEVMPYKWGKLMMNLSNAIRAITDTIGDAIEPITSATQQEFRDVLSRAGIRWISLDEVRQEWPEITKPLRGRLEFKRGGSTWQSLVRKQGAVETEFINGEIVKLAKKLGVQAPTNETLLRISQEMAANREPPGKYTPAQLCKILGLNKK